MDKSIGKYEKCENVKLEIYNKFKNRYETVPVDLILELIHVSNEIIKEIEVLIHSHHFQNEYVFHTYYELFVITSLFIADKLLNDEQITNLDYIQSLCHHKYNKEMIAKAEFMLIPYVHYVKTLNLL